MRPAFHWTEERIKAHIAICFTAYMLLAHLHYRVNLSAAICRLSSVKISRARWSGSLPASS